MDSGLTIRPSDSGALAAVARPGPTPVTRAVATELAPSQAVTAADNTARVRNDSRQFADQEPATRIDISFDKKTHVAVYKIIDTQTGRVILQVPQQARADLTV
jgi:FlaG protein